MDGILTGFSGPDFLLKGGGEKISCSQLVSGVWFQFLGASSNSSDSTLRSTPIPTFGKNTKTTPVGGRKGGNLRGLPPSDSPNLSPNREGGGGECISDKGRRGVHTGVGRVSRGRGGGEG